MELVGTAVDTAGVSVMVIGAIVATARFLFGRHGDTIGAYRLCRQDMGRSILLVSSSLWLATSFAVVHPSLDNVIVLGLIVLIRTFLSMSLQLELEGRWSWQNHDVPEAKPK